MEFKTSTTTFQTNTVAAQKRINEFQTSTQTTLDEILRKVSPAVQPNTNQKLVQGKANEHPNKLAVYMEPTGETSSSTVPEWGGVLAKPVQLEFPKFDGADPMD